MCHREHVEHVELAEGEVVGAELRRGEQGEGGHQVHLHISSLVVVSNCDNDVHNIWSRCYRLF